MPTPLSRFELAVVIRVQVSDLRVLRHYLAVEAAMEELARELPLEADLAAMTGFAAAIDAQLCAANPARRGEVAAEMLRTENAPPEVIAAVLGARKADCDALTPLAAALVVADVLAGAALRLVEDEDDDDDEDDDEDEDRDRDRLGQLTPRTLAMTALRASVHDIDPQRAERAADALGLTLDRAAELSLAGMLRVRGALEL